jgi:hypothetical protein
VEIQNSEQFSDMAWVIQHPVLGHLYFVDIVQGLVLGFEELSISYI